MALWVLFKDKFQEDPGRFRQWTVDRRESYQPKYEGMDEIDQQAEDMRGVGSASQTFIDRDPLKHRPRTENTGGLGYARPRRQHTPTKHRKYYRQ